MKLIHRQPPVLHTSEDIIITSEEHDEEMREMMLSDAREDERISDEEAETED